MSLVGSTDNPAAGDMVEFLVTVFGEAQGWVCIAFGVPPWHHTDSGSVRPADFRQAFRWWPSFADEVLTLLLENSPWLDVWVCPYMLTAPKRSKHTSLAPELIHADIDGGRLGVEKVREIPGAFAIYTGTPGNGHVYDLLTRPVKHHQHEQLCRALKNYFGATDSDQRQRRAAGAGDVQLQADC
jgi:hypothetical protein